MENNYIFLAILFYLIGSIPFAYILPRIFGYGDIRNIGSRNVGSTNVLRTGNKILAILVLLLDILKGFLPILLLKNFIILNYSEIVVYSIGSFAILGHIFPIWLKFNGGKGIATYIGYLFATNYLLGIIFIICWLAVAIIKKYSSLASIISLIIIPIITIIFSYEIILIVIFFIISFVIISRHYSNILRLFKKSENKISF